MRHKYMKSLLLAVVALLGFTVPSFAQDEEKITITVKFITTDNADLSGQDIQLGWGFDGDVHPVTLNADGTIDYVASMESMYSYEHLYYSINGISGSTYPQSYSENQILYSINLNKLRFNYAGSAPTNISVSSSYYDDEAAYSGTLSLNKDYYFPSGTRLYYKWGVPNSSSGYSAKSISLNEDTVIDLPVLRQLTIRSTMPESMKSSCYYNISKQIIEEYGSGTSIYYSDVLSTQNADDCIQTLEDGTYRVELRQRNGAYSSTTLGSKIIELTSDQTVSFSLYTVKVKVVEPDGTPVEGMQVGYYYNTYGNVHPETDANGEISFVVTKDTEITIYNSTYWDTQKYTITGNKTITLTVPKVISIRAKYNGKTISYTSADEQYGKSRIYLYAGNGDHEYSLLINEDGTFSGRAEANREYRIEFGFNDYGSGRTANSILVTDGMTLRIGKFSTKADGVGLDLFMGNGSSLYYNDYNDVLIGGTPVRIAAVPVGNEQFTCWDINGHQYSNPMIDFTPKEDATVATAKFTGTIANQVKSVAGQNAETIYVTVEGSYLVLPADVEAEAAIYAMDGKLTKKTGVVGNRIYISNLPDGAYVLVLTADGLRQTAAFVKQ